VEWEGICKLEASNTMSSIESDHASVALLGDIEDLLNKTQYKGPSIKTQYFSKGLQSIILKELLPSCVLSNLCKVDHVKSVLEKGKWVT
jgi:hypothetical protein